MVLGNWLEVLFIHPLSARLDLAEKWKLYVDIDNIRLHGVIFANIAHRFQGAEL
jgi:hypothetical protein